MTSDSVPREAGDSSAVTQCVTDIPIPEDALTDEAAGILFEWACKKRR